MRHAPIAAALLSALFATSAAAEETPQFTLVGAAFDGAGCPPDEALAEVLPDGRLAFTFEANVAQVGNGIPLKDATRRCDAAVTLEHAAGWQFAVRRYEVLGLAQLVEGIEGRARLWNYSAGREPLALEGTMAGPRQSERYEFFQTAETLVWSACGSGQSLKLALEVAVTPLETREGFFGQCGCGDPDVRLELAWRRCR